MKVIEHLSKGGKPQVSVEIIPPKRGANIQKIYDAVASIKPFDIPFINVTSHSAEVIMEEMADGTFKRRVKRKSPGTFGLCAAIKYKFDVDPVPHMLCGGFTREETEDALIELNYLGIENILAIRGDTKVNKPVNPDRTINEYAVDLVTQINGLNQGKYQDDLIDASKTNFCIGVACYPEKHFESPNVPFELKVLKNKQDAGAHYAVTQMFFDNEKFHAYVDTARAAGITLPIVPGLKILTSKSQLSMIPRTFHVDLPEELTDRIMHAKNNDEVMHAGIDWAVKQAVDLIEKGYPCVHFYIMQNTTPFIKMMEKLKKKI